MKAFHECSGCPVRTDEIRDAFEKEGKPRMIYFSQLALDGAATIHSA